MSLTVPFILYDLPKAIHHPIVTFLTRSLAGLQLSVRV
jgi:hypothetical protein